METTVSKTAFNPTRLCSDRHTALFLTAILAVGFLLRIICFAGISPNDDEQYAWLAHQMSQGQYQIGKYQGPPVWPLRVGLLVPVAVSFKVAGTTELAALFVPFFFSMASILFAFFAGRVFMGKVAGFVAAGLQAVIPVDVRMASWLLPDAMAALWANIGLVLLWYGMNQSVSKRKVLFSACSGLAFGISWLCKETIFYLFPFTGMFLLWGVWKNKGNLIVLFASAGLFLLVYSCETLTYYLTQNDVLFRFHETERNYAMTKSWFFTEGSDLGWKTGGYWQALLRRLFVDGPRAILFNQNYGFVTTAAALAIPYMLIHKVWTQRFLSLWFLSLVVMFNFGSSSLRAYQPIVLFDRYLYPLVLPSILLTAWFVNFLFSRSPDIQSQRDRFFGGAILSAGILAASCLGIYHYAKEGVNSPVQRSVMRIVSPQDIIYSDSQTPMVLNFLWGYPGNTHFCDLRGLQASQVPRGAYVLLDKKWGAFMNEHYGDVFPDVFHEVPNSWAIRWIGRDGALYFVGGDSAGTPDSSIAKCAGTVSASPT